MRPTAMVIVALLAVLATHAHSTVVHVPSDQPTIALGIAAADPGDTVEVAYDTYHESGLVIAKPITLLNDWALPGVVTIDGDNLGRILEIHDADGTVIEGIKFDEGYSSDVGGGVKVDSCDVRFVNCHFYGCHADIEGGGLRYRKGTPEIVECAFIGNTAGNSGAGLLLTGTTDGEVFDCTFNNNTAQWGGGAAIYEASTTPFELCTFNSNNAAGAEGYGGGAYIWDEVETEFTSCGFSYNTSTGGGGGACSDDECATLFDGCSFVGNSAAWGGGLFVYEPEDGSVEGSDFILNDADVGGGVAVEGASSFSITLCIFDGNNASMAGGGVALENCSAAGIVANCALSDNDANWGGAVAVEDCDIPVVIGGCTMALNEATGTRAAGAGVAFTGGTPATIENTIIAFGRAGGSVVCEEGASLTANTCVIHGNVGGDWIDCLAGQESLGWNSDQDPLFCGLSGAWFSLCENSYCTAAGNPSGTQIGALGPGCDACDSPVEATSWGGIKALYR